MQLTTQPYKKVALGALVILLILGILYATKFLVHHTDSAQFIAQFGVLGVIAVGMIAGFNVFIPVHAATFTPAFLAAGFSMHTIILNLAIGTTIADSISFALGMWSRTIAAKKYASIVARLHTFGTTYKRWIPIGVLLYAACIPFPNEALLIPLGLMGFPFRVLIPSLIIGNILNQTLFAFGFVELFHALFA